MKRRIILISSILILSLIFVLGNFLKNQYFISFCGEQGLCQSFWFYGIWLPFYNTIFYIIGAIVLFLFLPFSFLKIWLKIIIPYFIIALFFIISTPEVCSGIICFDRTLVASGFAKLFLILTILIIIGKSINLFVISKKKNNVKK